MSWDVANFADKEGWHERLWTDYDRDLPDLADVIDNTPARTTGRTCVAAWVRHETRAEFDACPACVRSAP